MCWNVRLSSRSEGTRPLCSVIDTSWSFSGVTLLQSCKINRLVGELPCFSPVQSANWLCLLGTSFLSLEVAWTQKVLRLAVSRNRGPGRHVDELLFLPPSVQHVRVEQIFRVPGKPSGIGVEVRWGAVCCDEPMAPLMHLLSIVWPSALCWALKENGGETRGCPRCVLNATVVTYFPNRL